jgi:hypothetical protein
MLGIIILLLFLVVLFVPQVWAATILKKYSYPRDNFPTTGGEFARQLLDHLHITQVKVEATTLGDHYDPSEKAVRLTSGNLQTKSLTAIVTAAHEVGHAIQDDIGYQPLHARIRLVQIAQQAQKIGFGLMIAVPFVTAITRSPGLSMLVLLGGLAGLGVSVLVHLITLPVEWDASFQRALPLLAKTTFLSQTDQRIARQILTACALTYVANSLLSLLKLLRWLVIFRR